MKKELVIAILMGLVIGFGLAAVFWSKSPVSLSLNQLTDKNKTQEVQPTQPPKPTKVKQEKVTLNITDPKNEIVHPQEELTISGKTDSRATVVVIWEEGEDILVADDKGNFDTDITLVGGENKIEIAAYDDEGNKESQTLTVTYSTADF